MPVVQNDDGDCFDAERKVAEIFKKGKIDRPCSSLNRFQNQKTM